jgi:hypothetical protein
LQHGDHFRIAEDYTMQVLCKASNSSSDIRCNVCGQGFLVYWTRTSTTERSFARDGIMQALRGHHTGMDSADAHPAAGFNVPEWAGEAGASAAAMLGNAPVWAVA